MMNEFQRLLLETIIAPQLMRVASTALAHPNAVRHGANIASTLARSNFVQQHSNAARAAINSNSRTGVNLHRVVDSNTSVHNNVTRVDRQNGINSRLPDHISSNTHKEKNADKSESKGRFKTGSINTVRGLGNALIDQIKTD